MKTAPDIGSVRIGELLDIASGASWHGDRKQPVAIPPADATARHIKRPDWPPSCTPSERIKVMVGSGRNELLDAWLPHLAHESGFDMQGGPVTDPEGIASALDRRKPKILLLDRAFLDRLDGRSLRLIHKPSAQIRVLLLCDEDGDDLVCDVLNNQFHGFLLTDCSPDLFLKAIRAVAQGDIWLPRACLANALTKLQRWPEMSQTRLRSDTARATCTLDALTPRETQIVGLVRRGWTNKQIARHLGIMEDTVKKHLQSIFTKLGVRRRTLVVLGQVAGKIEYA